MHFKRPLQSTRELKLLAYYHRSEAKLRPQQHTACSSAYVSEQFLNSTSAHYRLLSATKLEVVHMCCTATIDTYASLVAATVPNSNSTDAVMITTAICLLFITEICTQHHHLRFLPHIQLLDL